MSARTYFGIDWKNFALRPAAALLVLFCTQCGSSRYGAAMHGRTNYLMPGDAARDGGAVQQQASAPARDTESWWRGDGVSGLPGIVISLSKQRAWFYKGDKVVGMSIISSGDGEHPTPRGQFTVLQKDATHRSSQYGDYVDKEGNIVKGEIDREVDRQPPGSRYRGCEMPFFMRFTAGKGMHAGYLPGYPASHGCVRMPEEMARTFFANATEGTPVDVRR